MSMERAHTVALFGLPITNVTMAEAVARVEEAIGSGETHQIATANLDFAHNSLRDTHLRRVICDCSMVLPDGAPMLWASRLFGKPLRERVTGVDLVPELAALSARKGYGIFLLGSDEENCRRAVRVLEGRYPGVRFVGSYSPAVAPLHEMKDEEILARIEEAEPEILLVAFGNPKQEIWIHRNRKRLKVAVAIGIGGSLEMIAGTMRRAPRWVQRVHMEWLYRMAQEPGRLMPRYVRDGVSLLRHLPMGLAMNQLQPGGDGKTSVLQTTMHGRQRIVAVPGALTGGVCRTLVQEAQAAALEGDNLVVDLSKTTRVEADGLGALLQMRRTMLGKGLTIWLAGMSLPVRRVLQFSAMSELFRVAATTADAVRFAATLHEEDSAGSATMSGGRRGMSIRPVSSTVKA